MLKELFLSIVLISVVSSVAFAATPGIEVLTPTEGQVLQGNIEVKGTISAEGFVSAELSYAYARSGVETWFVIGTISQPVSNGVLAVWDTSTISDGNYRLKLSVKRKNGEVQDLIVNEVLVRNYTPVETTVTPTLAPDSNGTKIVISTVVVLNKPTPYPANDASLTTLSVNEWLKDGLIIGVVCLLALGAYSFFRGRLRRR